MLSDSSNLPVTRKNINGIVLKCLQNPEPPENEIVRRIMEVAQGKDVKPVQIALTWLFQKGATAPIVGTTKLEHLEEAVEAVDVKLTDDEVKYMEEPYRPKPVVGHR